MFPFSSSCTCILECDFLDGFIHPCYIVLLEADLMNQDETKKFRIYTRLFVDFLIISFCILDIVSVFVNQYQLWQDDMYG